MHPDRRPEVMDRPGLDPAEHDRALQGLRRTLFGINAAVVGILVAALFQPILQSAILGRAEFSLAITAFLLLVCWKQPACRVVLLCAVVGALVFT